MAVKVSGGEEVVKRRGDAFPARLRLVAHRGVTLVELMVAMLILTIVCVSWLEIIGIQSAKKEARRREAVERLAGMMDAFMYVNQKSVSEGGYLMKTNATGVVFTRDANVNVVHAVFDPGVSPLGYQLRVVKSGDPQVQGMYSDWDAKKWLVGMLYDRNDALTERGEKAFFTLPVCLGQ